MNKKTVRDIDVEGKKVLVRCDFNVPQKEDGTITDNRRTFNQLAIAWNVTPIFIEKKDDINKIVEEGIEKLKQKDILEKGDMVVVAGGTKWLESAEESKIIGGIARI